VRGDSSLVRAVALGMVPLALLGAIVALAVFYPGDDPGSGDDGQSAATFFPPAPALTPTPTAAPTATGTPEPAETTPPAEDTPPAPSAPPRRRSPAPAHRQNRSVPPVRLVDRGLADMAFVQAINYLGPVERNSSNGEGRAGDGHTISIDRAKFDTGLGVHADSRVQLDLGGRCTTFSTFIGLDDEEGSDPRTNEGAVVFAVTADGQVLFQSPVVEPFEQPRLVRLGVSGVRLLNLDVYSLGSTHNDHADWAGATLRCRAPS
jgi:hypothetical protein